MADWSRSGAAWEKQILAQYEAGDLAWHVQRPVSAASANGAVLKIYNDEPVDYTIYDGSNLTTSRGPGNGLIVAGGPNPDNETYTVTFKPGAGTWRQLGIEMVQDEACPACAWRAAPTAWCSPKWRPTVGVAPHIGFSGGTSNLRNPAPEYPPVAAFDGDPKTGWAVATYNDVEQAMLALRFAEPVETDADSVMTVRLHQDSDFRRATTGRFRLALSSSAYSWPTAEKGKEIPDAVLKALRTEEAKRTAEQKDAIAAHYQWASPEAQAGCAGIGPAGTAGRAAGRGHSARGGGGSDHPRRDPHSAARQLDGRFGRHRAARHPRVPRQARYRRPARHAARPGQLARLRGQSAHRARVCEPAVAPVFRHRASPKRWTISARRASGPRIPSCSTGWRRSSWSQRGARWDMKHMIRLIVTSHTYRQSSLPDPELEERDPDNRLLARQSRFRVDAENVRDIALAVSGLLVEQFGGPSVKPYQPDGYLAALNFPKREYSASRGDDLYRRGVYTFWQRTFLHPSLLTFDAPTREECTINRVNSNTPLQALVLLNDPIYVEAARVFAANILKSRGGVDWAVERALDRAPTAEERRILAGLYRESLAQFRRAPAGAAA